MRELIKTVIIVFLLILFAIFYFVDFKFNVVSHTKDKEHWEQEISEVYDQFSEAYRTLDADLVTNLYEQNAYYLSGDGKIVKGRTSIRQEFSRFFEWIASNNARMEIDFDIKDRTIRDSLAVDIAYYLITTEFPEDSTRQTQKSAGKFITVLRKQKNGDWKFKVDGYNPAPVKAFNQ